MAGLRVAILGASDDPNRYAHMAWRMLQEYGHEPIPVNPNLKTLEGRPVFAKLAEIPGKIDTLTMYVNPGISSAIASEILALRPRRVIFNPGSENSSLMSSLQEAGVHVVEACTLVLLRTKQFEKA